MNSNVVGVRELPINNVTRAIKTPEPPSCPEILSPSTEAVLAKIDVRPFKTTKEGIEYKIGQQFAPTYPQILDALGVPHSLRGKQLPPEIKAKVKEMQRTMGRGRKGALPNSEIKSLASQIDAENQGLRARSSASIFLARTLQLL